MPSFVTVTNGVTAQAQDVNQLVNALNGSAGNGIPISLTALNDSVNFALAIKNADATNSRALQVLRANNNVLIQADVNGVIVSPDGSASTAQVVNLSLAQTLTNKTLTAPIITSPVVSGGAFGAYTTWVPAVSQPGALGATINYATYQQIGKLALVTANITITGTGTSANRIVVSTLPIAPKYTGALSVIGAFSYQRTAASVIYSGSAIATSAAVAAFEVPAAAGDYMGVQPAFAAANTDVLSFTLCYEAA
jgi:hypothetical protein